MPDPTPPPKAKSKRGSRRFSLRRARDPRPPAQAPGSGGHVGERRVEGVTVRVLDFGKGSVREREVANGQECLAFEREDSPAWIQVTGLHDASKLHGLLDAYHIHPLVHDDILNTNQQPKVEDYGDYLFITARLLGPAGKDESEPRDLQHFAIILTARVVLSFQEAPSAAVDLVINRLREGKGRLREQGADYLTWALLDSLLDHYLLALDDLEDSVAALDEHVTLPENAASTGPQEIHDLRTRTRFLYRLVRPMREIAIALQRSESELLSVKMQPFLRDLYDHAWHAIETADHLREAVTAIREYHQAVLSQRMNEIMKVLAAISTVFLPLSFIAGVYGMNFDYMPELRWHYGYPAVWGVFLLVSLGMLVYFRRRRWI